MPSRSITRREGVLILPVSDTISSQPTRLEAMRHGGAGGFGRIAVTPRGARQPPADLDGRREVGLKHRQIEPDEADERRAIDDLDGPKPPAPRGHVGADPVG